MLRLIAFILLAVFLVLYGLAAISNIRFDAMNTIIGLSALAAGVLFFVLAIKGATA